MLQIASIISLWVAVAILAMFCWHKHFPDPADFFLKCVTPIGTVTAVLFALFGDFLKSKLDPVKIDMRIPEDSNKILDKKEYPQSVIRFVYVHHLMVENLTSHKAIQNCRVWLKKLYEHKNGSWKEVIVFAVPRSMVWAPGEFSPEVRTFCKTQIFDVGLTFESNGGFYLEYNHEQGGSFKREFKVGDRLGLVYYATADNYQSEDEFAFEVDIIATDSKHIVTPAKFKKTCPLALRNEALKTIEK